MEAAVAAFLLLIGASMLLSAIVRFVLAAHRPLRDHRRRTRRGGRR